MEVTKVSSHCKLAVGEIIGGASNVLPSTHHTSTHHTHHTHHISTGDFLGDGRFSSVWLANGGVAIKMYRSDLDHKYYQNEVKILTLLDSQCDYVVKYLSTFAHVRIVNSIPYIHPCISFDAYPSTLWHLIKYCDKKYDSGLPLNFVKSIMKQLFTALAYVHDKGIMHTDIKPANILMSNVPEAVESDLGLLIIVLADFGSSSLSGQAFSSNPGTEIYRAPELVIKCVNYGCPIDIWSAFTMCFDLVTGCYLFDVYSERDITYGEDVDSVGAYPDSSEDVGDIVSEEPGANNTTVCVSDTTMGTNNKSESLELLESLETSSTESSESSESDEHPQLVAYRHLLLFAKVIGYPDREFTENARTYYNRSCRLLNNPDVQPSSIRQLLESNYEIGADDRAEIEQFMLAGLKYNPEKRVTAEQALELPWLL